jgi:hypothetical protein
MRGGSAALPPRRKHAAQGWFAEYVQEQCENVKQLFGHPCRGFGMRTERALQNRGEEAAPVFGPPVPPASRLPRSSGQRSV